MMFESQMICNDYNKEIWLSSYIPENISEESTIDIMKHLITFICKNCNNLAILEFSFAIRDDNYIIELFKDCDGKSKLSNLKELYYTSAINYYISRHDNNFYPSNNVCNLNLLYVNKAGLTDKNIYLLSQFISSQKKLRHFVLSNIQKTEIMDQDVNRRNRPNNLNNPSDPSDPIDTREVLDWFFSRLLISYNYYETLINSLSSQSESLQIFEFRNLNFNISKEVLNSLRLLKNIKELRLYRCEKIDHLHSWVKELEKLEVFEIVMCFSMISESILIQLIQLVQSFSSNLTKLVITHSDEKKMD
ncbi:hypothetical protein C1645_793016, partial [Glomus cerebriforme]